MEFLNGEYLGVHEILWNGNEYIGIASSRADDASAIIITSKDGVSWKGRVCNPILSPFGMAWNGKKYVVAGILSNGYEGLIKIMASNNGEKWKQNSIPDTETYLFYDIIWDGIQFIAVKEDGGNCI